MKSNIIDLVLLKLILLVMFLKAKSFRVEETEDLPHLEWSDGCPKQASSCPPSFKDPPPLLLISLDVFRSVYLKRGFTPTLKKLSQCGVHAKFMQPVFPSKTFPNHFSIVTGLYPSSHGIICNKMTDPKTNKKFDTDKKGTRHTFWWEAQPIWVSAEKQGKKTAIFFWPGSEAEINGTHPTYWKRYNQKITFEARIDQVLKWLDLPPSRRPSFIAFHFNEPDLTAHKNTQNSKKMNEVLTKVDKTIERLFSGLQKRGLINCINVFFVSDHGMTEIDNFRRIYLEDYINISSTQGYGGAMGRIQIVKGGNMSLKGVEDALRCRHPHMKVFRKELLPVRFHYSNHPRIEPIFVYMDKGWMLMRNNSRKEEEDSWKGMHGYDDIFPEMRAFFMAIGPSMKKNTIVEPFICTELYELMCELIQIAPNSNNGTRGSLHYLLKSTPQPLRNPDEVTPPPILSERILAKYEETNINCYYNRSFDHKVNIVASKAFHLPFGIPHSTGGNNLVLLYNKDYVLSYNTKQKMASWVSFTLPWKASFHSQESGVWTADPRVPRNLTAKSSDYDSEFFKKNYILQRPLYPPVFSKPSESDASKFITNSIPKSGNHTVLEKRMTDFLRKWAKEKGPINVLTGPTFDFQATGIKPKANIFKKMKKGPLLIPTHIFLVITWCLQKVDNLKKCNSTRLVARSFLLPNWPYTMNCEPTGTTIQLNVARVVDVEKLTSLSLYKSLPIYEAVRLRTSLPHK